MNSDEKATVNIDADGAVVKCAKGLASGECGYVKGAEMCGKCGAMAVEVKMVPVDIFNTKGDKPEMDEEYMKMADGSYQIEDENDLKMAIMAVDNAENPQAAKMHCMKRAQELGMEDMIPKSWMSEKMDDEEYGEAKAAATDDEDDMEDDEDDMKEDEEEDMDSEEKAVPAEDDEEDKEEEEDDEDDEDDDMDEEEEKAAQMDDDDEDDMSEDEEEEKMYDMMPKKKKGMRGERGDMSTEDEDEDEDDMEEDEEKSMYMPFKAKKRKKGMNRDMDVEMNEEDDAELAEEMEPMRKRRIESMGMKSEDFSNNGYVCAIERKAYGGGVSVCDDCPGGCVSEKGLPGLLHIEGLAEEMFDGSVIDSGYSANADMYVVDVQVKDGRAVEVFVDGTTAEVVGWHKLDENIFESKSEDNELTLISFTEAAEIAVKSIDGHVVAVEPDTFEGYDTYAVEIDGFDGKSYDVFVAMDGEVLGYDKYEPEEAEEIEAEAAEIALKRAFSEDQRNSMAKEGTALPDGSFPISSSEDLRNAIQAFGRAKDKNAAKRHIMKRAKEMNMEKLIPATWLVNENIESKEKSAEQVEGEFLKSLVEFQLLELEEDSI
jgi:uncharacterized membrane protein YkoI